GSCRRRACGPAWPITAALARSPNSVRGEWQSASYKFMTSVPRGETRLMRVLHLVAGNLYGGIETLLATLARLRHLAPAMEPAFGFVYLGRLWEELTAAGVPVHGLGPVRISRPWTVWRARRHLHRVLGECPPEVAVVHGCWPHLVFGPTIRRSG